MLQDKVGQFVRFCVVMVVMAAIIMAHVIFHSFYPSEFQFYIRTLKTLILVLTFGTLGLFPLALLGLCSITYEWVIGTYPTATSAERLDEG